MRRAGSPTLAIGRRINPYEHRCEMHIVYVAPEHPYMHAYYDLRHQEEEERLRREDKRMLDEYVDHVRQARGTVTDSYLRMGEAAKEIVELAEGLDVGLVVLGSRGH